MKAPVESSHLLWIGHTSIVSVRPVLFQYSVSSPDVIRSVHGVLSNLNFAPFPYGFSRLCTYPNAQRPFQSLRALPSALNSCTHGDASTPASKNSSSAPLTVSVRVLSVYTTPRISYSSYLSPHEHNAATATRQTKNIFRITSQFYFAKIQNSTQTKTHHNPTTQKQH